ncbi:MAG: hypothetical protein HQK65_03115, partial [Desulfamplus sp.]|nr:hypothetical protein [Desulfamplus sp.]
IEKSPVDESQETESDELESDELESDEPESDETSEYRQEQEGKSDSDADLSVIQLMRLTKSELMDICMAKGIECEEDLAKADIIQLIRGA